MLGYHDTMSIHYWLWSCLNLHHVQSKRLKSFQQTSLQSRGDCEAGVPRDQGPQIPINSLILSPDIGEHMRTLNMLFPSFPWFFPGISYAKSFEVVHRKVRVRSVIKSVGNVSFFIRHHAASLFLSCPFKVFQLRDGKTTARCPAKSLRARGAQCGLHVQTIQHCSLQSVLPKSLCPTFTCCLLLSFAAYCHTQNYVN